MSVYRKSCRLAFGFGTAEKSQISLFTPREAAPECKAGSDDQLWCPERPLCRQGMTRLGKQDQRAIDHVHPSVAIAALIQEATSPIGPLQYHRSASPSSRTQATSSAAWREV